MTSTTENNRYIVQVYVGALSALYEALSVEASKQTTSEEIVSCIVDRLSLNDNVSYELAEVIGDNYGQECKERSLLNSESPVQLMMLWPKNRTDQSSYRFYLREKTNDYLWRDFVMDPQLIRDYFHRFLYQPKDREYPDLCQLPDLNEQTLLDNLRARFVAGHIYTYVGSILIALNPFKFYPIYNPKYVKLYQNRRLGPNLPPHIFAVADTAYHCMLKDRKNQCIVISGESGSGKTESTNFLLHHLTALSQKGSHGSGVEQTILSAGPVLEAFGNAKTAHNNNSSRFGKFIQVNYKENGMVHGAVVQKYLLEKSRICCQGRNERNYHVFYYLLEGASEQEKQILHLKSPDQYYYLNKSCYNLDNVDERYEFSRLKQSMEMVGFTSEKQRRLFSVLSAVLLLGNVEFQPRKSAYHHDEAVGVKNPEIVTLISELLRVKQETLMQALVTKKARVSGEILIINYRLHEAIASRDAMAKCLYGALFDWIVLQVNHALLSKKDTLREHQGNSIGVLDIFGFEDFGLNNSFEQLCINYANEHLQYYFNQHVFKYEQEEYRKEGIKWTNIEFMDNTGCLQLIEGKPNGLLCLLDDQCNFPGATNETLLQKFNTVHKDNKFYQKPQKKEGAFIVVHYAGKVKYQVADMREKNLDLMRQDIVGVLKNSSMAFVRELVGADPVAVFRWAIVRAFFRSYFAFNEAGRKHRQGRVDGNRNNIQQRYQRNHVPNENLISKQRNSLTTINRYGKFNEDGNRLSWPQFYQQRNNGTGMYKKDIDNNEKRRKESLERVLCPDEARAIQKANQIVMKNKSFRPRERGKKGLKNLQSVKTLAGRTGNLSGGGQLGGKARKQPTTVTAQFQQSLHSLMDTLNQANPFFIRCIKSNSDKIPNKFDHETVQRQLRYTGMLETVRIRQAGFNVRLTYDEFIQLYRILLPKGLLSSQNDVKSFLATLNLNRDHYQLGTTKIFLRESEKYKLDCKLHQQIMASIIILQRWFRSCLERKKFIRIRHAIITIQSYCRMYLVQKQFKRVMAAIKIQKIWRGYKVRCWYEKLKLNIVDFQAHCRGFNVRKTMLHTKLHNKKVVNSRLQMKLTGSDEAFVSKESSQEELHNNLERKFRDSDESSGIQEDGDTESLHSRLSYTMSLPTVTTTFVSSSTSSGLTKPEVNDGGGSYLDLNLRKKINKIHRTIDYSELEYNVPTTSSDLEGAENGGGRAVITLSAPIIGEKSNLTATSSSMNRYSDENFSPKAQLTRSPAIHWTTKRNEMSEYRSSSGDSLKSLPPIRRFSRFGSDEKQDVYYAYDHAPSKIEQILGKPEAPIRNVRKAKRSQVKSLGEEVIDGSSIDKSVLGTIDESNIIIPPGGGESKFKQTPFTKDVKQSILTPKRQRHHLGLDLRRRNSDPATNLITIASAAPSEATIETTNQNKVESDAIQWRKTNFSFTLQGHSFRKIARITKDDVCDSCNGQIDQFITHGYKCMKCKNSFHAKCIQNKKISSCDHQSALNDNSSKGARRKHRKHSRTQYDLMKSDDGGASSSSSGGKFNLTGTSLFSDSTDQIINGSEELHLMQQFITEKIMKIENDIGEKPSEVDRLFKQALREFKDNLVQIYSANKHGFEICSVRYKDLICNFQQAMETVCQKEKDKNFPVTMGLNAFRGFMNEFMLSRNSEEKPNKFKKEKNKNKKRKYNETIKFKGHTFILTIINIPTACEICSSFFMWPIERGLVCQSCKLTCHKKCHTNIQTLCVKEITVGTGNSKIFGVPLVNLITEDNKIPLVIEKLLHVIELNGLYTEGIYRKSGVNSKIKELKLKMDENPFEIEFEKYQVHVLASVLKSFLREMPEPLLTFECYENFITASNLKNLQDRVTTLYDILKKLPPINYDLMERLMFHLARVALHEDVNRMSPASLAIVFAPCVLRTNKLVPAQDSLHDIANQTQCIETIIREQLKKIRNTLDDINTLDTACQAANNRLSSLRSSKVFTPEELNTSSIQNAKTSSGRVERNEDDEEHLLVGHIQEIQKEKEHLTSTLPTLTHATSDDDMLSTDGDGSMDDISCCVNEQQKKLRLPIIRTISTVVTSTTSSCESNEKLKRQSSSSDVSIKADCDDSIVV